MLARSLLFKVLNFSKSSRLVFLVTLTLSTSINALKSNGTALKATVLQPKSCNVPDKFGKPSKPQPQEKFRRSKSYPF